MFNYKGLAFEEHSSDNFHVLHARFLDYNCQFRDITVTWSQIGRKSYWLAQFSGFTTEYTGDLTNVLDNVIKHYNSNKWQQENTNGE